MPVVVVVVVVVMVVGCGGCCCWEVVAFAVQKIYGKKIQIYFL